MFTLSFTFEPDCVMDYKECERRGAQLAQEHFAALDKNEITPDLATHAEALYNEKLQFLFESDYKKCEDSLETTRYQVEMEFYLHMWCLLKP